MTLDITSIDNFFALPPRFATAGQPTRAQYPSIATAGYTVVINLACTDSPNALSDEAEIAVNLGLEYFNIPVDFKAPTLTDLQRFAEIVSARIDRQIFIHCAANKRVSVFMYLYRHIYEAVPESIARADLNTIWEPNAIWQQFIDTAVLTLRE
jgi:protein tyrosine phosphatase (PTP) superfamily phosphohydrolase (DUF442 family)